MARELRRVEDRDTALVLEAADDPLVPLIMDHLGCVAGPAGVSQCKL